MPHTPEHEPAEPVVETSARFHSANPLPPDAAVAARDLLTRALCASMDLYCSLKHAHWNTHGPAFFSLHEFFDQAASMSASWADLLAERLGQLGFAAPGTIADIHRCTPLSPHRAADCHDGQARASETQLSQFATLCRSIRAALTPIGDDLSVDILTQIGREAEAALWKLEAYRR